MPEGFRDLDESTLASPQGVNEINRMMRELYDLIPGDGNTVRVYRGYGTPESAVAAGVGSIFLRLDGGAGTTVYAKESGTGDTGWSGL